MNNIASDRFKVDALWVVQAVVGLAICGVYLVAVADLPRIGQYMLPLLIVYGGLLLISPRLWLLVLPAVTVSLDLSPWSGRFLFSEYDGFVAITIAVGLLSGRFSKELLWQNWLVLPALFLYLLLYIFQVDAVDAFVSPPGQQFDNPYYSDIYSYKVGKGLVWGFALALLWMSQVKRERHTTLGWSIVGVVVAAWLLFVLALWERGTIATVLSATNWWEIAHAFLDFSSDYRITGIFADMHTGGEVIDGLMILLLPLIILVLLSSRNIRSNLLLTSAVVALGYCIVVGVTRATWVAAVFGFMVSGLMYLRGQHRQMQLDYATLALIAVSLGCAIMHAVWLQTSGGSDALVMFILMVAVVFIAANQRALGSLSEVAALLAALALIAYGALRAHLSSRYAVATGLTMVLVPASVLVVGVGLRYAFRQLAIPRFASRAQLLVALVVFPVGVALALGGYSMGERIQGTSGDLQTRFDHWERVVSSSGTDVTTQLVGNGVGSFPKLYIENYPQTLAKIGSYVIQGDAPPRLQLGVGDDLAFIQRVELEPWTDYELSVRVRSAAKGVVRLIVCRQNQLIFDRWAGICAGDKVAYGSAESTRDSDGFEAHSFVFNSGRVPDGAGWQRWPVSLQVVHASGESSVELTDFRLKGPSGDVLVNGAFQAGSDAWFFQANFAHLPWHVKNLWLQLWFETGWLGLLLFLALLTAAAFRAWKYAGVEPIIAFVFPSIAAVFVVGAFGSPLDSARVSTWFYMLFCISLLYPVSSSATGGSKGDA